MNDFFAGCTSAYADLDEPVTLLGQLRGKRATILHRSPGAFLMHCPESKVIDDVLIEDGTGSWLSILGMPLIDCPTEESRQRLLREVLRNPGATISNEIDGHFALFAYDAAEDRFITASDINSFLPIYYTETQDGVFFSSSELLLARIFNRSLTPLGMAQALYLSTTWGSGTRYSGIEKLLPAQYLCAGRRTTLDTYWKPSDEEMWSGTFGSSLEKWMQILEDSVLSFRKQAVPCKTSSDLTSGEDSRLIASQLNSLGIDYTLRVTGDQDDADVKCSSEYAKLLGLSLTIHTLGALSEDAIADNASRIALANDGYGSWFYSADKFELLSRFPPLEHTVLHFSGVPGGEVFRGSYYLRAGVVSPSARGRLDSKLLSRMKFLLDFMPGLLKDDRSFAEMLRANIDSSISEVASFRLGTQVDHVLRCFQVSQMSRLSFPQRQPFYWPLGTKSLTRSVYALPPQFKAGSRLTRAATEKLFPELAYMRTARNTPTVPKRLKNLPMFLPGYYSTAKKIGLGVLRRLLHYRQRDSSLSRRHRIDIHGPVMMTLLNEQPYATWFRSTSEMITGEWYDGNLLNSVLDDARVGNSDHVELLGRVINQEMAARFVNGDLVRPQSPREDSNLRPTV